jgi:hypothetical protein
MQDFWYQSMFNSKRYFLCSSFCCVFKFECDIFVFLTLQFETFGKLIYLLQDSGVGTPVTLRVDKYGFYLYWVDQNKVGEFVHFSTEVQQIRSVM